MEKSIVRDGLAQGVSKNHAEKFFLTNQVYRSLLNSYIWIVLPGRRPIGVWRRFIVARRRGRRRRWILRRAHAKNHWRDFSWQSIFQLAKQVQCYKFAVPTMQLTSSYLIEEAPANCFVVSSHACKLSGTVQLLYVCTVWPAPAESWKHIMFAIQADT